MLRRAFSLLVFPVAGLLASCNSRDSLYSQGPWGPPDMRRSYSQYASPWGRALGDHPPLIVSGTGYSAEGAHAIAERPVADLQWRYRASGLPADPRPPAAAPMSSQPASSDPEPVSPPGGPSLPTASAQASPDAISPPGVFAAPRRASSYAGTWKARDSEGRACLVHLSSAASLDLYKASVSKCASETLRHVNLWRFEGNNVSLFTRGVEIARLEGSEASLSGSFNQSGASLQMTR